MTQIMIDIQPATMRVYQAEAERRGLTGVEFISALLADWPAILAPVQPGSGAYYKPEPLSVAIESDAFLANLDNPRTWFVDDAELLARKTSRWEAGTDGTDV